MNRMLILTLLPVALSANADCLTDPFEIGDIGPSSGLVCQELAQRFPGATLAVEGRFIHSPSEVTVSASVDGRPILLAYRVTRFTWKADGIGSGVEHAAPQPARLSQGH